MLGKPTGGAAGSPRQEGSGASVGSTAARNPLWGHPGAAEGSHVSGSPTCAGGFSPPNLGGRRGENTLGEGARCLHRALCGVSPQLSNLGGSRGRGREVVSMRHPTPVRSHLPLSRAFAPLNPSYALEIGCRPVEPDT